MENKIAGEIKINVDMTDVDIALAKVRELNEELDKAEKKLKRLSGYGIPNLSGININQPCAKPIDPKYTVKGSILTIMASDEDAPTTVAQMMNEGR